MLPETLAVLFLLMVAAVPTVFLIRSFFRPHFSVAQALLLNLAILLTRLLWRAGSPPRLPERGGAIIVCNHRSSVDPFFVQVCCDRPIRWLVAREYCEHPMFRWFLSTCNVIPVNRAGVDTAATKTAIRCVRDGGIVGMFPEGRINMTDEFMLPVRPGAILVALKTAVPLIPCHIVGSPYDRTPWSPFMMSARVRVEFGDPIDPTGLAAEANEQQAVRRLILNVVGRIADLAGKSDFEPRLAGRRWKPGMT